MDKEEKERLFTKILEDSRGLIYTICFMYATSDEHLKDLQQESLINIWQGLDSFKGNSKESTWVYRVCINTCVSFMRKEKKSQEFKAIEEVEDVYETSQEHVSQLKEMYHLISQLNKIEKAIIMLWLDDKQYNEIADIMGMPRNTIATRIRRIKEKLVMLGNR